jgi:hypothetical protein
MVVLIVVGYASGDVRGGGRNRGCCLERETSARAYAILSCLLANRSPTLMTC